MSDFDFTERMKRGCLINIPNLPCTRCGWDPDAPGNGGMWPSLGGMAVRWMRENLIFGEGDFFGQPFNPMPDQRLFLYRWYEYCPQCDQWRFQEALRMELTGACKTEFGALIDIQELHGPPIIAPPRLNEAIHALSRGQADLSFGRAALFVGGRHDDVTPSLGLGPFEPYHTHIRFKRSRP